MQESLIDYSFRLGEAVLARKSSVSRKEQGQFLTPPAVARYMAWQLGPLHSGQRILDPSIGSGILSSAVIERAILDQKPIELWLDCFDIDADMCATARQSLEHAAEIAAQSDVKVHFTIHNYDFALSDVPVQQSLLPIHSVREQAQPTLYDHIIANPPYFKLRSEDVRAKRFANRAVSHTNIYSLFIALAIPRLANMDSRACFIVPRSFCSGAYFADFRRHFLQAARPLSVHLFESRDDIFQGGDVLQESIIVTFTRRDDTSTDMKMPEECVNISTSSSTADLNSFPVGRRISIPRFWHRHGGEYFFKLPVSELDEQIVETVESWPESVDTYGLEVSTGPVVPFRAIELLCDVAKAKDGQAVPLLWLQHVQPNRVTWPLLTLKKQQAILNKNTAAKLLVRLGNFVLIRRFSAKEERRRLIAAPLLRETFPHASIGLENHLNYLRKKRGDLTPDETVGLAAIYNSAVIDRYFRIVNGNTQVNASELRRIPLPPMGVIREIGRTIRGGDLYDANQEIEDITVSLLRKWDCLPDDLPNIEETQMAVKKLSKIQQAQDILRSLGLPVAQQNEQSGLTLLALCQISEDTSWKKATPVALRIHDILKEIKSRYGRDYAENTRETIRRQVIHQFEQAGLVIRNADDPDLPTNSPKTRYTLTDEALNVVRTYGTRSWPSAVSEFVEAHGALIEIYQKNREQTKVPLRLASGKEFLLSPGKHNLLQAKIINEFGPRFAPGTQLLYLGDTARKSLVFDVASLEALDIPTSTHDKLPDIVLFDVSKNWIFLIEAVTSHGPVSPKRQAELQAVLKNCSAKSIFVSAFPDFATFKKFLTKIAWETEVWLADMPSHLIHFNGDRFLGPH